jgi:heme/copper-type cytochrome/quinol oxidase subunit 2
VAAIAFVFVFGLGALIGLMAVMKYFGFNDGVTNGFTVMVFMLMVAVEAVFTWMLVSGRRAAEGGRGAARLKEQTTQELEGAGARSLPDPAPSVTEHATRTFEPLHRERGSK